MFNITILYLLIGLGVAIWYVIDQREKESVGELAASVVISIFFGALAAGELLFKHIYGKFVQPLSVPDTKNKRKK